MLGESTPLDPQKTPPERLAKCEEEAEQENYVRVEAVKHLQKGKASEEVAGARTQPT